MIVCGLGGARAEPLLRLGVAHLVAPERAGAGSIDRDARRPPT